MRFLQKLTKQTKMTTTTGQEGKGGLLDCPYCEAELEPYGNNDSYQRWLDVKGYTEGLVCPKCERFFNVAYTPVSWVEVPV